MASLNINPTDDGADGALGRSLLLINLDTQVKSHFPLATLPSDVGPLEGQPMHTALTPDRKAVFITLGGSHVLPLRLVKVRIDWANGTPSVRATHLLTMLPSGTGTGEMMQEGHGPQMTKDGRFLVLSELNSDRIRIFDVEAGAFVGEALTGPVVKTPHGFWPNASRTRAASTQYTFQGDQLGLWALNAQGHASLSEVGRANALKCVRGLSVAHGAGFW